MHMRNSILVGLVVLATAASARAEPVYNFYFPVAPYAPWDNVGSAAMNPTSYATLISPKAYTGDVWNTDTTAFHSWAETQDGLPFPETTLTSSDGLSTGVTVAITGNSYGHGFYKGGATPMPALQGGIFASDTSTITFSGLGAGTKWEIYFLTCLNAPDQAAGFTFGGQTKLAAIWSTGAGHTTSNDSVNHWEAGYDYLHFAGSDGTGILAPTGTITGTWEGHSWNGFQLVQLAGPSWPDYLPGDFNLDGEVGPEDFGILKDGFGLDGLPFGKHESWTLGDANDDGEIGPEDFGLLKDNFGLDGGPTGTYPLANVPEPTTLSLLALGGLLAARKNRRAK